jgi:hypothetical protein
MNVTQAAVKWAKSSDSTDWLFLRHNSSRRQYHSHQPLYSVRNIETEWEKKMCV